MISLNSLQNYKLHIKQETIFFTRVQKKIDVPSKALQSSKLQSKNYKTKTDKRELKEFSH